MDIHEHFKICNQNVTNGRIDHKCSKRNSEINRWEMCK